MATIFLIHGSYGNPIENWFPWLKKELEQNGHTVFAPPFPTPENQSLEQWFATFEPYEKFIDPQTIFVGHSLGAAFILSYLEHMEKPIRACFFVAGFCSALGNPQFDILNKTFVEKPFLWKDIRKYGRNFFVFHSDNDPYVPLQKGKELASHLGTEVMLVKGAGHFNKESNYTKFPLLLEKILETLKKG
ncbi:serine hydrolase family protein [Candidatus Woesearchaeota archaeon]|nr:serine hydrolase family protein [Candidatus Woesearchaeota archaeon]